MRARYLKNCVSILKILEIKNYCIVNFVTITNIFSFYIVGFHNSWAIVGLNWSKCVHGQCGNLTQFYVLVHILVFAENKLYQSFYRGILFYTNQNIDTIFFRKVTVLKLQRLTGFETPFLLARGIPRGQKDTNFLKKLDIIVNCLVVEFKIYSTIYIL